ncbi:MAG: hypothetical protein K0S19_1198 [Geminicoccaceae bacterium]|nr:hypothetical protein [Geminicoccaceae bacterium]
MACVQWRINVGVWIAKLYAPGLSANAVLCSLVRSAIEQPSPPRRRSVPGCAASLASKGVCPIGISVAVSRSQLTHSDTAASSLLEPKETGPPTPMVLPGR